MKCLGQAYRYHIQLRYLHGCHLGGGNRGHGPPRHFIFCFLIVYVIAIRLCRS